MNKCLMAALLVLLLTACGGPKYEVRGDVVVRSYWTFSFGMRYDTLPGADPATFVQIKDWLGFDSKQVFFETSPVPGADVATVKAKRYPLFCDKNDYYYKTKPLHVADMKTFKTMKWYDDDFWAKDSRYVYYDSVRVQGVDLPSFKIVSRWYARDKHHIYMDGLMLVGADPATFMRIDDSVFFRDKAHVWRFGKFFAEADAATFEVMGESCFCRDKSHVWYDEYECHPLVGADPATFEVIGDTQYCRDKSHIWFRNILLSDADYATFVADYDNFAHDKYGSFTADHRDTIPDETPFEEPVEE